MSSLNSDQENIIEIYFDLGVKVQLLQNDCAFHIREPGKFFGRYILSTISAIDPAEKSWG